MHRKSIEAAEHLKSDDNGNERAGSGGSPTNNNNNNNHQGGPASSESGQESQDGINPTSSSGKSFDLQ